MIPRQVLFRTAKLQRQRAALLQLPKDSSTFAFFSSESEAAVAKNPPVFKYPNAEALFHKIVKKCKPEEVSIIGDIVGDMFGRPAREREFYYRGIGGKSFKGSGGQGGDSEEAVVAEKTTFDVKLTGFDPKAKIKVIKEVRAIAGLGLKEAKDLVESAPKIIQTNIKKEQAEELKKKLEELGAQIEIV
eukprot:CAMPEP_0198149130 /NCGR_PEP_ID=MMETSP1443-20131203/45145_1 /TAXON_ID=186043 /ORGANISM="Entomoneis sp., Strain CCMP2396" /LENGTH=187 /DNA_ID=CAMNT_0043814059 /DNA_START=99 /DNA_END=662 /DNA_ORIENTATION=-